MVSEATAEPPKPAESKEPLTEPVMLKETPIEVKPDEQEPKEKKDDADKETAAAAVDGKNETTVGAQPESAPAEPKKAEMLIIVPGHQQQVFNPAIAGYAGHVAQGHAQGYPYHNVWSQRPSYSVFAQFAPPKQPKQPEVPAKRFDPLGEFNDKQKRRQFYQDLIYTQLTNFASKIEPMIENEQNVTERNDMEEVMSHLEEFKQILVNHQLFNISQIMEDWKQGKIKEQDEPTAAAPEANQPQDSSLTPMASEPDNSNGGGEPKTDGKSTTTAAAAAAAHDVPTVLLIPSTFQTNQYAGYRPEAPLFRRQYYDASRPLVPTFYRPHSATYGVRNVQPAAFIAAQDREINYNRDGGRTYHPNEMRATNYYQ